MGVEVNREFKRRMRREQAASERGTRRPPIPVSQQQRRERVRFRQYLREIQGELKRVQWPTFSEVVTYSVVVVVVVSVLTAVVFLLDLGFTKTVVQLFKPAS